MHYAAASVLLLVLLGGIGLSRLRCGTTGKTIDCSDGFNLREILRLSENQIEQLLLRLEKKDPPPEPIGAMCYFMSSPTNTSEYICPQCGEKTVYSGYLIDVIEWRLQDCRRLVDGIESITETRFLLDERGYCQHCTPSGWTDPQLRLLVSSSSEPGRCCIVSLNDLMMLDSFVHGWTIYQTPDGRMVPLRSRIGRLRELLGFPPEEENVRET